MGARGANRRRGLSLATRIAGIPELVEDGVSGILTAPGDSDALAAAMERLLSDAALRNRIGTAGRAVVEHEFNASREAARLSTIITQAMQGTVVSTRPHGT